MRKFLIIPIVLFALNVNAQISSYHKTASELNYVSEVEDMTSDEIVNYNKWIEFHLGLKANRLTPKVNKA